MNIDKMFEDKAQIILKPSSGKDFKKAVLTALSQETANPHVVIWFDFDHGWCIATGNGMDSSDLVKEQVAHRIQEVIQAKGLSKLINWKAL